MEILVIIVLLLLLPLLFVFGGLSGHALDLFGKIISFLADGCMKWVGCLFAIIVIFLLLCVFLL